MLEWNTSKKKIESAAQLVGLHPKYIKYGQVLWDGGQTGNTYIIHTSTSQEFQLLSVLSVNLKHLRETKR